MPSCWMSCPIERGDGRAQMYGADALVFSIRREDKHCHSVPEGWLTSHGHLIMHRSQLTNIQGNMATARLEQDIATYTGNQHNDLVKLVEIGAPRIFPCPHIYHFLPGTSKTIIE